ncbi:serine--tRNA ligase, mitochondrial-like [Octopus vulgaris]|uniref:serine--tRNA ligase n=1 Tax=Octopus vulgaris TaxID=6645 RepID=A0AA36AWK2_OCTVU|nr:serine--tRNA ligase, mitochondrial-like [Octopus vulgaris]
MLGNMYGIHSTLGRFQWRTCKHFSVLRALLKSEGSKCYRKDISIDCLSQNSYQDLQSTICPEFDWDYLCNPENTLEIKENIRNRKGIGDIDAVHRLWKDVSREDNSMKKQELIDKLKSLAADIPNKIHPLAPIGNESCNRVVKTFGKESVNVGKVKGVVEIGEKAGWLRTSNVGTTTGQRSYYFLNQLARLELALVNYCLDKLRLEGFQLVSVPEILRPEIIEGCGFKTTGERTQVYKLDAKRHGSACLSGTSEMALAGYFQNQVFSIQDLPMKLTAVSRCHRAEVSELEEEKGIYRVHNFTKVEMFSIVAQETGKESDDSLQEFVDLQTDLYQSLGLHCRLLNMASQELGAPASRKFDYETWMPAKGFWGEISSASNCTDYQSRRLGAKYKNKDDQLTYVHTINGTACAVPRLVMAIIENNQLPNGSVLLPQVLHPYFRGSLLTVEPKSLNHWKKSLTPFTVQ